MGRQRYRVVLFYDGKDFCREEIEKFFQTLDVRCVRMLLFDVELRGMTLLKAIGPHRIIIFSLRG